MDVRGFGNKLFIYKYMTLASQLICQYEPNHHELVNLKIKSEGKEDLGHFKQMKLKTNFTVSLWDRRKEILMEWRKSKWKV